MRYNVKEYITNTAAITIPILIWSAAGMFGQYLHDNKVYERIMKKEEITIDTLAEPSANFQSHLSEEELNLHPKSDSLY